MLALAIKKPIKNCIKLNVALYSMRVEIANAVATCGILKQFEWHLWQTSLNQCGCNAYVPCMGNV